MPATTAATRPRLRRAEIDRPAGAGRLAADAVQGFVAAAVIGNLALARRQHGAVDLAKARPLVLHPGLRGGHERQRRRVGRNRESAASARMPPARGWPRGPATGCGGSWTTAATAYRRGAIRCLSQVLASCSPVARFRDSSANRTRGAGRRTTRCAGPASARPQERRWKPTRGTSAAANSWMTTDELWLVEKARYGRYSRIGRS